MLFKTLLITRRALPARYPASDGTSLNGTHGREHQALCAPTGDSRWRPARLYLIVQPSGAKSWAVRFRIGKQPKKLTLGPYPLLSLAIAREQARAALRAVTEGRNPIKERTSSEDQERMASSRRFGVVAADFLERYVKPRNRTWRETERVLTKRDFAVWRELDVASITRADVLAILDRIVERGSPIQANRVLAALRRFFGWALERGLIESSPVSGVRAPSPEVARDRVLSDQELTAIYGTVLSGSVTRLEGQFSFYF